MQATGNIPANSNLRGVMWALNHDTGRFGKPIYIFLSGTSDDAQNLVAIEDPGISPEEMGLSQDWCRRLREQP